MIKTLKIKLKPNNKQQYLNCRYYEEKECL